MWGLKPSRWEKAPTTDESAAREEIAVMKQLGLTRAQAQPLIERRYGIGRRRFYEMWIGD